MMIETLFILLTAHFLSDFVLQTDRMAQRKKEACVLLVHAFLVTIVSALMLGRLHASLLMILFLSHLAIDALKVYLLPDGIYSFLLDQLAHIGVIYALALAFDDAATTGLWLTWLSPDLQTWYMLGVTCLGGVLLCAPVGGVVIGIVTRPLQDEIRKARLKPKGRAARKDEQENRNHEEHDDGQEEDDDVRGLLNGGKYIGWLERYMVLALFLIGQPSGIGFLFAAKSILRFGEIRDSHQRKTAEYIIIGTFLSFGWALTASYLTQQALTLWQN